MDDIIHRWKWIWERLRKHKEKEVLNDIKSYFLIVYCLLQLEEQELSLTDKPSLSTYMKIFPTLLTTKLIPVGIMWGEGVFVWFIATRPCVRMKKFPRLSMLVKTTQWNWSRNSKPKKIIFSHQYFNYIYGKK